MAREFAKRFYNSKAWKETSRSIMLEYNGICQKCHDKPAEIVHHIIWLTPQNINNPEISLGRDNLIPVCRDCHALIHEGVRATVEGISFDSEGNVIYEDKNIHNI